MRYISTRGQAEQKDFSGVLLAGLAADGGLYMPQSWPQFSAADLRALRGLPYPELAARVLAPFMGDCIEFADLQAMCRRAYAGFTHKAIVPLVQLDTNIYALELFHGPTLAFKDMALQLVGHLFEHVLAERGEKVRIVGATSGDTGSAAIEAVANRKNVDITILHPEGKTSEVQRRQMTTVKADNVLNIAVAGNFDDCQDLVKAMFADAPFRAEMNLSAVNSINFARIAAQIPYYVYAALNLGAPEREVAVSVPTGNFGNILAAWAAHKMGVPISALHRGEQPQRHPGPLPGRQRHERAWRGAEPFALHGYPGQLQFRAAAVRVPGPGRGAHRADHGGFPQLRENDGGRAGLARHHPGFRGLPAR